MQRQYVSLLFISHPLQHLGRVTNFFGLFSFFILLAHKGHAQQVPTVEKPDNQEMKRIVTVDEAGWVRFKPDLATKKEMVFKTHRAAFGLSEKDDLQEFKKTESGKEGHYKYQQFHDGVPVQWAQYALHTENGRPALAHGRLVEGIKASPSPKITEKTALQTALNHIGARKYAWQDPGWEQQRRSDMGDSAATYYPKGMLTYVQADFAKGYAGDNYVLAYEFEVRSLEPGAYLKVYVDAAKRTVVRTIDLQQSCFTAGAAHGTHAHEPLPAVAHQEPRRMAYPQAPIFYR